MRLDSSTRRRALLTAVLVVVALVVTLLPTSSAASPAGSCTFYSNASHTTVVGQRGYDCCNNYIKWGVTSSYYVCGGCFICYPPPRDWPEL